MSRSDGATGGPEIHVDVRRDTDERCMHVVAYGNSVALARIENGGMGPTVMILLTSVGR